MNIFVQQLASTDVDPAPDLEPTTLVVEDNVGEGVHVHLRNVRVEMSVADFETFADHLIAARDRLDDGHR